MAGRRPLLTAAALVVVELYFFVRYAENGADVHFWLHALLGGALGLWLLTLVRLLRPRDRQVRQWRAHEAILVGHLYSAAPDVAFLLVGALHVAWMDVFALHISAHFLWPQPLVAALVTSVAFLGTGLLLRAPAPTTLQEVVEGGSNGSASDRAWSWVCRVEV